MYFGEREIQLCNSLFWTRFDLLIAAFALRHPLHVLHGECHAFARRRDRAPVERRSRVRGISGSATAATSVFIAPSLVLFGVQSP